MMSILNAAETPAVEPSKIQVLLMNILPFVLIFVVFYFLLIRPQKKKQQQHQALLNAIKVGDKVVLSSGITGKITKIKDDTYVIVEIANNVEVEVLRSVIASIVS